MIKLLSQLVLLAVAARATDQPLAQKTSDFFNNFYNPVQYYADDATLTLDEMSLPFGGQYNGTDEINEFYAKLAATVKFAQMQFETKYLDPRTGIVKAETKFMDGLFRGRLVDEATRRFSGDKFVEMIHLLEFDVATGELQNHDILLKNAADVQKMAFPKAQKHLYKMSSEYFKEANEGEEITADSDLMDMVDEDVKVNLELFPKEMLGKKREFKGKDELINFENMFWGKQQAPEQDEKDTKYKGKKGKDKKTTRNLLAEHEQDKKKGVHKSDYDAKVIYADDNKVEMLFHFDEHMMDGVLLEDFDVLKMWTFDDEGMLVQQDVVFGRTFEPWELMKEGQGEEKPDGKKDQVEKDDMKDQEDEKKQDKKKDEKDSDDQDKPKHGDKKNSKDETEDDGGKEQEDKDDDDKFKVTEGNGDSDKEENEKEDEAKKKETEDDKEKEDQEKEDKEKQDKNQARRLLQLRHGHRHGYRHGHGGAAVAGGGVSVTKTTVSAGRGGAVAGGGRWG